MPEPCQIDRGRRRELGGSDNAGAFVAPAPVRVVQTMARRFSAPAIMGSLSWSLIHTKSHPPVSRAPFRTAVGTCHGSAHHVWRRGMPCWLVSLTLGRIDRGAPSDPRARLGLLAHFLRSWRLHESWTVRALLSGSFGFSLSRMLPELVVMVLYGGISLHSSPL